MGTHDMGAGVFNVSHDMGAEPFDVTHDMGAGVFNISHDMGAGVAEGLKESTSELTQYSGITSFYWSGNDLAALADDDPITSWEDQHSGRVVSEIATSQNPLKKTFGGRIGAFYDGLDDRLLDNSAGMDLTSGATVFHLTYPISTGDRFGGVFGIDDANGPDGWCAVYHDQDNRRWSWTTNRQTTVSATWADYGTLDWSTVAMWTQRSSSLNTNVEYWENRNSRNINTNPNPDFYPDNAGSRFYIGGGYQEESFHGYIFALAIYAAELTTTQIQQVWDDLEAAHGGPF